MNERETGDNSKLSCGSGVDGSDIIALFQTSRQLPQAPLYRICAMLACLNGYHFMNIALTLHEKFRWRPTSHSMRAWPMNYVQKTTGRELIMVTDWKTPLSPNSIPERTALPSALVLTIAIFLCDLLIPDNVSLRMLCIFPLVINSTQHVVQARTRHAVTALVGAAAVYSVLALPHPLYARLAQRITLASLLLSLMLIRLGIAECGTRAHQRQHRRRRVRHSADFRSHAIRQADEAMYEAKARGKGCSVVW